MRILIDRADGYFHMAADELLTEICGLNGKEPVLRIQIWDNPGISIGRHQGPEIIKPERAAVHGLDIVRRPSGGGAVLHLDDFTYSFIAGNTYANIPYCVQESYRLISQPILNFLNALGIDSKMVERTQRASERQSIDGPCFNVSTAADLTSGGSKICGSAQARLKKGILQHGTLPLRDRWEVLSDCIDEKWKVKPLISVSEILGIEIGREDIIEPFIESFLSYFNEIGRYSEYSDEEMSMITVKSDELKRRVCNRK